MSGSLPSDYGNITVANPLDVYTKTLQARKGAIDVQNALAGQAANQILQQATDKNTGVTDYLLAGKLAASAGPQVGIAMRGLLKDASALRGAQINQASDHYNLFARTALDIARNPSDQNVNDQADSLIRAGYPADQVNAERQAYLALPLDQRKERAYTHTVSALDAQTGLSRTVGETKLVAMPQGVVPATVMQPATKFDRRSDTTSGRLHRRRGTAAWIRSGHAARGATRQLCPGNSARRWWHPATSTREATAAPPAGHRRQELPQHLRHSQGAPALRCPPKGPTPPAERPLSAVSGRRSPPAPAAASTAAPRRPSRPLQRPLLGQERRAQKGHRHQNGGQFGNAGSTEAAYCWPDGIGSTQDGSGYRAGNCGTGPGVCIPSGAGDHISAARHYERDRLPSAPGQEPTAVCAAEAKRPAPISD